MSNNEDSNETRFVLLTILIIFTLFMLVGVISEIGKTTRVSIHAQQNCEKD